MKVGAVGAGLGMSIAAGGMFAGLAKNTADKLGAGTPSPREDEKDQNTRRARTVPAYTYYCLSVFSEKATGL